MQEISLLDVMGRLLPSLALVVGGLLLVRRLALRGRGGVQRSMRVVARVGLSRSAHVAVVQVGDMHYLVGATDQNVNLLAELPEDVAADVVRGGMARTVGTTGVAADARTMIDSPWTGLVQKLQEVTLRRERDPGARHVD